MTPDELLKIELPSLRNEMLDVKKCQHQLFIFEIMATGAIVGFLLPFISTILEHIRFWPVLFFLSPLIIVIPSQYLLLDKAITINRICSYFKTIEHRTAGGKQIGPNSFGWENGCAEFRRRSNELAPVGSSNPTQGPNHFYKLTFVVACVITFILLVLMGIFYALSTDKTGVSSAEIVIMVCLSCASVICLIHHFNQLQNVLKGKLTILAMAQLWENIL